MSPASPALPEGLRTQRPLHSVCEALDASFTGASVKAHTSSDDDAPSAHSGTLWGQATHSVTPPRQAGTGTGDPPDAGAESEPGCGAFA